MSESAETTQVTDFPTRPPTDIELLVGAHSKHLEAVSAFVDAKKKAHEAFVAFRSAQTLEGEKAADVRRAWAEVASISRRLHPITFVKPRRASPRARKKAGNKAKAKKAVEPHQAPPTRAAEPTRQITTVTPLAFAPEAKPVRTPELIVLDMLSRRRGGWVSSGEIASATGVDKASVPGLVMKAKKVAGRTIQTSRRRGACDYRMA